MGTDRYAYLSRLRRTDPIPKFWLSISAMLVCLFCESISVGVFTMLLLGALTVYLGRLSAGVVIRFLKIPIAFLLIGCITIVFRPISEGSGAIFSTRLFGRWLWGITPEYLSMGSMVFFKAMGTISAMYFLSLNTPMTDLVLALERLHTPRLIVELMELIYRFIFVLTQAAERIRVAQESRLGYVGFKRSVNSLGVLSSMVFLRAWKQSDRVWSALESRGYNGNLKTLPQIYEKGSWLYAVAAMVVLLQLGVLFFERGLLP